MERQADIALFTAPRPDRTDPALVPILQGRTKIKYWIVVLIWVLLAGYFWTWWLQPQHVLHTGRYILISVCLFWLFFLQIYFIILFLNSRHVAGSVAALGPARVAMVVTKTPSEPLSLLTATLEAMLAQDYPHDTWLADEDPTPDTIAWCAERGIRISTRKDRPDYHRKEWPRRTRCKEGNLAFFYDHYGYEAYDFVSQLDADHVPSPTYLRELLKPFADPRVGYVSAPSICSSNAAQSWAARSRLFTEAMFHGALQAGYSGGWAPMCIGSHYAVRTSALKRVGGLGPELAEDHSTSLIMNAGGWRGVHAIDAIAHGAGPATISDMATQEFQWSRSLVSLLLQHTPRYLSALPVRLRFQFLFSQMWYPLVSLFMLAVYAMPIIALSFDVQFADVTYPAFVGHAAPPTIILVTLAYMIRRDGFFRPLDAKVISWEKMLFAAAQWPWMFWGCVMAVRDWLTGRFVDFRITPKGKGVKQQLPAKVLLPYVALALGSLAPVILVDDVGDAAGFYILSVLNALLYIVLVTVIVVHHWRGVKAPFSVAPLTAALHTLIVVGLLATAGHALYLRGAYSLYALSIGLEAVQVVEIQSVVSGAGKAPPGELKFLFRFGRD